MLVHSVQPDEMEGAADGVAEEGDRTGAPVVDWQRRGVGVCGNAGDTVSGNTHVALVAAVHRAGHRGPGETIVPEADRQVGH